MLDITKDIHPVTDFKRNTTELVRQMKETGQPIVLTINGRAELVVQDAASYQRLLELVDRLEAIAGIQEPSVLSVVHDEDLHFLVPHP